MGTLEQQLRSYDLASLCALGRALKGRKSEDPDVLDSYRAIGNLLIKKGEPLLAFALIDEGLKSFPLDSRLRQLLGLGLARSGATGLAHCILDELHEEELRRVPSTNPQELVGREETLSMLGRIYKDLGHESWHGNPIAANRHWEASLQLYLAAYSLRMNYYPGINAAAIATVLRRHDMARHLAKEVPPTMPWRARSCPCGTSRGRPLLAQCDSGGGVPDWKRDSTRPGSGTPRPRDRAGAYRLREHESRLCGS